MGGYYDAYVDWFRFEYEPSYCLRFGSKYDFSKELKSLDAQFAEQAIDKGRFSIFLHGGWKNEAAYERVLNFFHCTGVIFANDEEWGPDFGLRKERQQFLFPEIRREKEGSVREELDHGYYRVSLLPPAELDPPRVPFEELLDLQENEQTMSAINTMVKVVRECRERNHWLGLSFSHDC